MTATKNLRSVFSLSPSIISNVANKSLAQNASSTVTSSLIDASHAPSDATINNSDMNPVTSYFDFSSQSCQQVDNRFITGDNGNSEHVTYPVIAYLCPGCLHCFDVNIFQTHFIGGTCQQNKSNCVTQQCTYCSHHFATTDLTSHETVCENKKNNQTITYKHCPKCNTWLGTQQFQQHACLDGQERQETSNSLSSGSGANVLSMVEPMTPVVKFHGVSTDVYPSQTKTETETEGSGLHKEWYIDQIKEENTNEIKAENRAEIKTDTHELYADKYREEMEHKPNDIAPLFHTENILVIKPETETDIPHSCRTDNEAICNLLTIKHECGANISQPCRVGNVLVIKPENEHENPEQCRDGYVTGIKTESEAGRSFDNNTDGSTKHESELS